MTQPVPPPDTVGRMIYYIPLTMEGETSTTQLAFLKTEIRAQTENSHFKARCWEVANQECWAVPNPQLPGARPEPQKPADENSIEELIAIVSQSLSASSHNCPKATADVRSPSTTTYEPLGHAQGIMSGKQSPELSVPSRQLQKEIPTNTMSPSLSRPAKECPSPTTLSHASGNGIYRSPEWQRQSLPLPEYPAPSESIQLNPLSGRTEPQVPLNLNDQTGDRQFCPLSMQPSASAHKSPSNNEAQLSSAQSPSTHQLYMGARGYQNSVQHQRSEIRQPWLDSKFYDSVRPTYPNQDFRAATSAQETNHSPSEGSNAKLPPSGSSPSDGDRLQSQPFSGLYDEGLSQQQQHWTSRPVSHLNDADATTSRTRPMIPSVIDSGHHTGNYAAVKRKRSKNDEQESYGIIKAPRISDFLASPSTVTRAPDVSINLSTQRVAGRSKPACEDLKNPAYKGRLRGGPIPETVSKICTVIKNLQRNHKDMPARMSILTNEDLKGHFTTSGILNASSELQLYRRDLRLFSEHEWLYLSRTDWEKWVSKTPDELRACEQQ